MKQTIKILGIENTTGKSGRQYVKIKTDIGNCSAFEQEVIDICKNNIGASIVVEIAESNGFKNIRAVYSEMPKEYDKIQQQQPNVSQQQPYKEAKDIKTFSMYLSYGKDLIIGDKLTPENQDKIIKFAVALMKATQEL